MSMRVAVRAGQRTGAAERPNGVTRSGYTTSEAAVGRDRARRPIMAILRRASSSVPVCRNAPVARLGRAVGTAFVSASWLRRHPSGGSGSRHHRTTGKSTLTGLLAKAPAASGVDAVACGKASADRSPLSFAHPATTRAGWRSGEISSFQAELPRDRARAELVWTNFAEKPRSLRPVWRSKFRPSCACAPALEKPDRVVGRPQVTDWLRSLFEPDSNVETPARSPTPSASERRAGAANSAFRRFPAKGGGGGGRGAEELFLGGGSHGGFWGRGRGPVIGEAPNEYRLAAQLPYPPRVAPSGAEVRYWNVPEAPNFQTAVRAALERVGAADLLDRGRGSPRAGIWKPSRPKSAGSITARFVLGRWASGWGNALLVGTPGSGGLPPALAGMRSKGLRSEAARGAVAGTLLLQPGLLQFSDLVLVLLRAWRNALFKSFNV